MRPLKEHVTRYPDLKTAIEELKSSINELPPLSPLDRAEISLLRDGYVGIIVAGQNIYLWLRPDGRIEEVSQEEMRAKTTWPE
jgi:hypothetical protein